MASAATARTTSRSPPSSKPAYIQVPLFIKEGEMIKVDSRTGAYMGRA